ncbi:MAG: hypothetical protein WCJ97_10065 [Phycisphaerae bacterium]
MAAKLQSQSWQDLAEIEAFLKRGGPVDYLAYELPPKQIEVYQEIATAVKNAPPSLRD